MIYEKVYQKYLKDFFYTEKLNSYIYTFCLSLIINYTKLENYQMKTQCKCNTFTFIVKISAEQQYLYNSRDFCSL